MTTKTILLGASVIAASIAGAAAIAQTRGAPAAAPQGGTVTYWMSAETTAGMAAMTGAAPQAARRRPSIRGILTGRAPIPQIATGPSHVRSLTLQLGSPRSAAGAPSAEHVPPAGLGVGPSLPLLTPAGAAAPVGAPGYDPRAMPTPQGRILIYWGCGDRARAGQPIEIDMSRIAQGQVPPLMQQMAQLTMTPPSPASSRTYGHWPNERSETRVPETGSLVGPHVVRGNYTPEISFTLAPNQDFLAPITLTSNSPGAGGAVPVAWQSVPNARAYFMAAMGAAPDNVMVIWTSSEVEFAGFGGLDYLAEADIARLLQQRVLLPSATTQCTVPAEVAGRVQAASLMLNAFGPEANFSHPARPARAPRGWQPDWVVKLRTRSAYMGMLGMDMEAMMRGEQPERRRRRR